MVSVCKVLRAEGAVMMVLERMLPVMTLGDHLLLLNPESFIVTPKFSAHSISVSRFHKVGHTDIP